MPSDNADSADQSMEKSIYETKQQSTGEIEKPSGLRLILIFVSLCMSTFLVALDGTIIATAIPTITSQFNSLSDVSWYNAAFLLTTSAFQLPYGRAYTLLNTKYTFISSILIFMVGSAVCGATPGSIGLIIGRAIAGIGGAGVFSGCFIVIAQNTPLRKRSLFNGFLGATFAIAAIIGPLLGGAFTTRLSWRWCFYINLPIGAIALLVVTFVLPSSVGSQSSKLNGKAWWQILKRFDPVGTLLIVPSIVCLLLALQWGGQQYPWGSPRVIVTFTLFGVTFIVWAIWQIFLGDEALVPRSVICQRSAAGATFYTLCGSAAFTAVVYYLPLWFQAIRQDNAQESGIHTLAITISVIVSAIGAGGAVAAIGYYTPFLFLGSVCTSVGAALLMLLKPDSNVGTWIGYQILMGAGVGMSLEQANIAIQTVLPEEKVSAGISLGIFARGLGGSLAVSISQNVFEQKLKQNLGSILPNLDSSIISGSGATNLINNIANLVEGDQVKVQKIIDLYNNAVTRAFMVALILSAVTFPAAFLMEWKNIKKEKTKDKSSDEESQESKE